MTILHGLPSFESTPLPLPLAPVQLQASFNFVRLRSSITTGLYEHIFNPVSSATSIPFPGHQLVVFDKYTVWFCGSRPSCSHALLAVEGIILLRKPRFAFISNKHDLILDKHSIFSLLSIPSCGCAQSMLQCFLSDCLYSEPHFSCLLRCYHALL